MAWFRRKNVDPSVLPEVDKYYTAERRERTGLAWLLALVSIAVVAAIIIALFLAGRFIYSRIVDKPDDVATTQGVSDPQAPSFDGNPSDNSSSEPESSQNGSTPAITENNNDAEVNPASPGTSPATPVTGDDSLPSTGPSSLVAVFASVSTVAAGAHYAVTRRKQ
ncbi:hypothetical protein H0V99_00090 [Candidatus Saccharibacteria bacterium]|nr:hypothetical protein [Candidatus Saccharibacteria bacterium]